MYFCKGCDTQRRSSQMYYPKYFAYGTGRVRRLAACERQDYFPSSISPHSAALLLIDLTSTLMLFVEPPDKQSGVAIWPSILNLKEFKLPVLARTQQVKDTYIYMDQTLHEDKWCGRLNNDQNDVQYTEQKKKWRELQI
jgi:hypothetical protein